MKRGDVVVMVVQGDLGKPRPAVVIQADELGSATTSVLMCPLTSELDDMRRIRPVVEPDANNGLRLTSQIMADKVAAVSRSRIRATIGSINAETRERLDRALLIVLGFAR